MVDREKVIKGLGNVANAIVDGYICEPDQAVNTIADAIALLKELQEQNDRLIEESASNAEMAEGLKELLKEHGETELCDRCGRRRLKSNMEVK